MFFFQSPSKSVMLTKHHDECSFNLFWETSLACSSDDDGGGGERLSDSVQESCVVQVPGFDQKLDLKALSEKSFYEVQSG